MLLARLSVCSRIVLIVVGGYMLTGGLTALFGLTVSAAGMPLSDAMLLSSILGFLFYPGLIIWGFSSRLHWRKPLIILMSSMAIMRLANIVSGLG